MGGKTQKTKVNKVEAGETKEEDSNFYSSKGARGKGYSSGRLRGQGIVYLAEEQDTSVNQVEAQERG